MVFLVNTIRFPTGKFRFLMSLINFWKYVMEKFYNDFVIFFLLQNGLDNTDVADGVSLCNSMVDDVVAKVLEDETLTSENEGFSKSQ